MAPPIDYRQIAAQKARQYGVPVADFLAQIGQESGFSPTAHSGAGADGIAQFIPSTARAYGVNTSDPVSSLDGAARYDRDLLKQYGTIERALSAYNSGRPDAYKDPNFAGGQTYNYVRNILARSSNGRTPGSEPGSGGSTPSLAASLAPAPQQPDRVALMRALLGASSSGDYAGFYTKLGNALHGSQAAAPAAPLAPPAAPGAPQQPLPAGRGQIVGNTSGEQPAFVQALAALAGYEHAPVDINSGYRSTQKQAQLYANRASNPNPVAPPGHSLHEQGLAADGTVGGKPLGTLPAALLARFGLQSVPGDPVHVQLLRGGR